MSKKIMREFQLDEISTVDRPAQKGARMTIMKRDDVKENPDMTDTVAKADLDAAVAKNADLEKELAKAKAFGELDDAEKEFLAKMTDPKAKDEFLAAPKDKRKEKMSETVKNDETIAVSGVTLRKSEVGEAAFAIAKAQDAIIKSMGERVAKAEADAAFAKFEKKAADELGNLPGTDFEKAEVLVEVAKMPTDIAERLMTLLKAANAANAGAFEKRGVNKNSAEADSESKLQKAADEIRKANPKLTEAQAYVKALELNPELYEG